MGCREVTFVIAVAHIGGIRFEHPRISSRLRKHLTEHLKIKPERLTKSKAFVVLAEGQRADADELKAFVKNRLAPYKYPRAIEFVDELPKTATGKIQRFRLREHEAVQ